MPASRTPGHCGPRLPAALAALAVLVRLWTAGGQATYPSEFRLSWCVGSQCFDHSVSAAHFQLRISRYYAAAGRPPLREAFFMATLPVPVQRELLFNVPGMMVLAHLLLAEARLYTHGPEEAAELARRARAMLAMPALAGPHLNGVWGAWPLRQSLTRYEAVARMSEAARRQPMSVDLVLPLCNEDITWINDRSRLELLPAQTRVFIYEKCKSPTNSTVNLTVELGGRVQVIRTVLEDARDPVTGRAVRRDECTAYLTHVARHYGSQMADVLLFLHGNPGDHTPFGLLNLFLRGLALGTLRGVDFLHLGAPRMVYTSNPCQADIFQAAMGRRLKQPLSTYCCAQFAVSKRRIRKRPRSDYLRMLKLVDGSTPDICDRVGPAYELYKGQRLSHCFFFEFMWHVVFGEAEDLPLRADDARLPPTFRLKDNEEELPSLWRSYVAAYVGGQMGFAAQGHEQWLRHIGEQTDLALQQKQINFGDGVVQPTGGARG